MANTTNARIDRLSSKKISNCFCRRPIPVQAMMPPNRKRKEVVEPSSFKPQLSLLRDRDKLLLPRHRVPALEHGTTALRPPLKCPQEFLLRPNEPNPGDCSISTLTMKEKEKNNGCSNSANNCPMAPLKYFHPSVPFFFLRLFSSTSCPCSLPNPSFRQCYFWTCINRNDCTDINKSKSWQDMKKIRNSKTSCTNKIRDCKNTPAISVFFIACFLFFAELIHIVNATPLPSIPTPTQTTELNMTFSEDTNNAEMKIIQRINKKRFSASQAEQDDDGYGHHHQLYTINNTTFDGGGPEVDEVKEMKNEKNGVDANMLEEGHSRARNLYSDSIKNDSKNRSGNQAEFTSPSASPPKESPNNSNNKNKVEFGSRKGNESRLPKMPLALRMRTGAVILSSSSPVPSPVVVADSTSKQQQQQDVSIQVTNDLSQEMKESSSKSNGDDESSFVFINNNHNDDDDDNRDSMRVRTGKCRTVFLGIADTEENETDSLPLPSTVLSQVSDSSFISSPTTTPRNPIRFECTGASVGYLEVALTSQIPEHFIPEVISIVVKDSLISTLNLSLFHRFPRLENISVTHSNVNQIIGKCPQHLKALNISFNSIKMLNGSIFSTSEGQDYEYEEDDGADKDSTLERNNDSENIATNFSAEVISSYFGTSVEQQQNKSEPELELLSLSSSSSPPVPSVIPITGRFSPGYYSQKLMGTPFFPTRTKKVSKIPFLTNEEKRNELQEKDLSVFGISVDQRPRHQDKLIKTGNMNLQRVSHGLEAGFLETAETNESSVDEDEDDDNDGDYVADSRRYKTKSDDKTFERVVPTGAGAAFSIHNYKTANTAGCGNNDSLCESIRFVRRRRQVIGELDENRDGDNHQHQQKRDDEINVDVLKNEGYVYEQEKAASSGEGRGYYYHHYHHPISTSSSSTSEEPASRIVNKRGNEIKAGLKAKPTIFSVVEKGRRKRKRKARATTTTSSSSTNSTTSGLSLEDIDIRYNKIDVLPKELLQLKSLKSLRLAGNPLKHDFVWSGLADWYMNSPNPSTLTDADETFLGYDVFQFSVLGVIRAKKDLVRTCRTVDKSICRECSLYLLSKQPGHGYNLSHQSPHGNVAIALKLDCSYSNLTELPAVPPQTWQLNVSGNAIKDLIPLREPMYENLLMLDADSNEINTLDGLTGTSFLDKYNYLSLRNNSFSVIPSNILSSLKNMRGQGVSLFGANFIECTSCDTVKEIKPLLLENSKKIKDFKEIYCKDMKARSAESFMAVKDLQFKDLCYLDSEESNEMYLYVIILIELLLIVVIVGKVWHDQRTFRRTGILPWFSAFMPRLPCDAMLESVKEPPHFNRSSSTNVRSYACEPATQSISSCVQLRDVRSNSGQSEKSSSQISHLSSFPGSSRTSSV